MFQRQAQAMERALEAQRGPFFLGEALTTADLVFVPYVERMNASLAYYKGFVLRREHPAIHRWLMALGVLGFVGAALCGVWRQAAITSARRSAWCANSWSMRACRP